MTAEKIKDIKRSLECCLDDKDCDNCPYSRKNAVDRISHCHESKADISQLLDDYEQRIAQLELELEQRKETE